MPQPIDYATPDVNRKAAAIDAVPFCLGALQLLLAIIVTIDGSKQARLLHIGTLQEWYEWPPRLWLADGWLGLVYLLGSGMVVLGAMRPEHRRERWYWRYAVFWIVAILLTESSLLVLSPWPGERHYQWVLLHNMRGSFVDPNDFMAYPYLFLVASPSLLLLVGRNVWRKMKDAKQ